MTPSAITILRVTLIGTGFAAASAFGLDGTHSAAWAGTVYCVRADGTASISDATGPPSDPSRCMDLSTFNRAVLDPGDTVLFSDSGGEYTGQLNPRSGGVPDQFITLKAAPGERPTFNGLGTHHQIVYLRRDYVILDGFEVYNGLLGADSRNVEIGNASHVIVENMTIHGAGFAGIYVHARDVDMTDVTIRNNEIYDVGEQSAGLSGNIFVAGDDDRRITDSSIYGNQLYNVAAGSGGGEAGVSLANIGSDNAVLKNIDVYNNTIHDIEGDGIRLAAGVFDSEIYDNMLANNARHYRLGGMGSGDVSRNEIWHSNPAQNPLTGANETHDGDQAAIYLDGRATDNTIHNLVLDSNRNGIVLHEGSGNTFFNIAIKNAERVSIRNAPSALGTVFSDITVVHSTMEKYNDASEIIAAVELGAGSNAVLKNTIVFGTGSATEGVVGVWMQDSTVDVSYDGVFGFEANFKLDGGAQPGPGVITGDPMIENLPDGPFTLAAESPSIDAGTRIAGIHDAFYRDIAGQLIVGLNDIGAYKDRYAVPLLGDINIDGEVNGLDVDLFIDLVVSGMYQVEGDTNEDGFINGVDVGPFVALIVGDAAASTGDPLVIPEPATAVFTAIGLLGLGGPWWCRRMRPA